MGVAATAAVGVGARIAWAVPCVVRHGGSKKGWIRTPQEDQPPFKIHSLLSGSYGFKSGFLPLAFDRNLSWRLIAAELPPFSTDTFTRPRNSPGMPRGEAGVKHGSGAARSVLTWPDGDGPP